MTPRQEKDFFNKVKGKKIRWCFWEVGVYFIPNGILFDSMTTEMEGTYFYSLDEEGMHTSVRIGNGFEEEDRGGHWILLEDPTSLPTSVECNCNLDQIMLGGCKCGAFEKEMILKSEEIKIAKKKKIIY